jgi:hypothetical protein
MDGQASLHLHVATRACILITDCPKSTVQIGMMDHIRLRLRWFLNKLDSLDGTHLLYVPQMDNCRRFYKKHF